MYSVSIYDHGTILLDFKGIGLEPGHLPTSKLPDKLNVYVNSMPRGLNRDFADCFIDFK